MDDLLVLALKSKLPFIGITTDDTVHLKTILQTIAGKKIMNFPVGSTSPVGDACIWLATDPKIITDDNYRRLSDGHGVCIVVNQPSHALVFDAGVLHVPPQFIIEYLQPFVMADKIPSLLQVLQGLSLKGAKEIVQITMARSGCITPQEIRRTRMMLSGQTPGLYTLDTDYDFYVMPKVLKDWLDLNDKYFLDPNTPQKLRPRGILLTGEPGVGKSMASMVIAKHWDVPLFRLDISTSLNRFLGESESRIARNLQLIEENAPAVFLMDELEKLFGSSNDDGTTPRILSQILWMLQNHRSRVLTVMTSNDISKLPKELYRPGRIDRVIEIQKLTQAEARSFSHGVYQNLVGKPLTPKRMKVVRDALYHANKLSFSHAEITELTYSLIKKNDWMVEEK